jgi:hypothetical protein
MDGLVKMHTLSRPFDAQRAHDRAQGNPGMAVLRDNRPAGFDHAAGVLPHPIQIQADERRRDHAEVTQGAVTPADIRRIEEHIAEVVFAGQGL